ncbi:RNA methyltransferase [bacterium]|nr:RNA methyltransferase [bacterium]
MVTPERWRRIAQVVESRQPGVVVLEDVHDPHNAAAVLRSCDAFGIQTVHFVFREVTPYNPVKVGKVSSSSANQWLDFVIHHSTDGCFRSLEQEGYQSIATVISAKGESLFQADLTAGPWAIWFGNEHRGLSEEAIDRASRRVAIPMRGMVESLNISVTAAIFLFEMTRQRSVQGMPRLPQDQMTKLMESFGASGDATPPPC